MPSLTSPVDHDHRGDEAATPEPQEYTPLLPRPRPSRTRIYGPFFIFLMMTMLVIGITIGIYLLVEQDREWPVRLPFNMVFRSEWGAKDPTRPVNGLTVLPTTHVILTHTGTASCSTFSLCSKILMDMQNKYQNPPYNLSDVPFNFLIGDDGKTYEGRGFALTGNIDPAFDNRSISVGLIGDFTSTSPSSMQLNEAMSLIVESIRRKKISPQYLAIQRPFNGEPTALVEIIKNWKHWSND